MIGENFLLGVNYWPRSKAMYWWKDFLDTDRISYPFLDFLSSPEEVRRFYQHSSLFKEQAARVCSGRDLSL